MELWTMVLTGGVGAAAIKLLDHVIQWGLKRWEGRRTGWTAIAIAGRGSDFCWPCGACRQMLYEFAPGLRVLAARGDGAFDTATLDQLMPHGFGPLSLK